MSTSVNSDRKFDKFIDSPVSGSRHVCLKTSERYESEGYMKSRSWRCQSGTATRSPKGVTGARVL